MIYHNETTRIRPALASDLSNQYVQWLNDPQTNIYTSRGIWPVYHHEAKDYLESLPGDETKIVWAIEWCPEGKLSGTHIGNIALQQIDLLNRSAELAILIGNKSAQGQGHATRAMRMVIAHGFTRLGLNRIWAGTAEGNEGFRKAAIKCGMGIEGVAVQALWLDGKFVSVHSYAITRGMWDIHQQESEPALPFEENNDLDK